MIGVSRSSASQPSGYKNWH